MPQYRSRNHPLPATLEVVKFSKLEVRYGCGHDKRRSEMQSFTGIALAVTFFASSNKSETAVRKANRVETNTARNARAEAQL